MNNENENESKFFSEISSKISELESYKKKLDKSIYELETKYLENTQSCGNIVKGWDQFFTTKSKIGGFLKKTKFSFNERLFSQSSFNNSNLKEDGMGVVSTFKSLGNVQGQGIKNVHHHNGTHKKKILSSLSLKKKKLNGHQVNSRHVTTNNEHQQNS